MGISAGLEDDNYFVCGECNLPFPSWQDEDGGICSACTRKLEEEEQVERESDHKREGRP